jgi:drug/metabolite transporter (DMT)-like permease
MSKLMLAHLALIASNILYAGNYTIAKWIMPSHILPFGFIFIRVLGALIFFWTLHFYVNRESIDKKDFLRLFFCGMFGVAINQLMFFKGLDITTPVNASLMMVTTPILVITIAILAKVDQFSWVKVLGISLGALGAVFILMGRNFDFNSTTALGDFFVFINATSYGIYLTIVKPLMKKYRPVTIIKWVFTFGFIPVFFFGFKEFNAIDWSSFTNHTWGSLVYVVLGVTCFAYLFNIFALSKVNPSVVGIYIYLQPFLAALIAIYFEADKFDASKFVAAICIFLGVYLVSFYKPKPLKEV